MSSACLAEIAMPAGWEISLLSASNEVVLNFGGGFYWQEDDMLSQRQLKLLSVYQESNGDYLRSTDLANRLGVTSRTIRSDNKAISEFISVHGAELESVPSKGTRLLVTNNAQFSNEMRRLVSSSSRHAAFNERSTRAIYILYVLSHTKDYVPRSRLENKMFVSPSTLSGDLNEVKRIIRPYSLNIESKPSCGIRLRGTEANIRRCIIMENVLQLPESTSSLMKESEATSVEFLSLNHIVTECLIKHEFKVSDYAFQTIIVHLSVSLGRMRDGHYVESEGCLDPAYQHALEIAEEILEKCCKLYKLEYSEAEAQLIAINLQGKREIDSNDYVSKEINDFVYQALLKIREEYSIDLTTDMSLRLSLALHVVPLLTRARFGMQLNNDIIYDVKQLYVLAFDIASTFAQRIQEEYKVKLAEGEVSYIAMRFCVALENHSNTDEAKSVLLISPERKSDTILIQQKLMQWFPTSIGTIDIISARQIDETEIDAYDAVFTTDPSLTAQTGAIPINFFLSDNDYSKIKLAINGYSKPEDLIEIFSPDMFFAGHIEDKEDAFRIVAGNAENHFPQEEGVLEAIQAHERYTNSYFGNLVAMPHPNIPMTDQTFISVAVSDKPLDWDENAKVRLVMMVCLEKENPAAYTVWQYLSMLITNSRYVDRIIAEPTYENLMSVIRDAYHSS
jgi:lichenan operon transcriptional antiterminator